MVAEGSMLIGDCYESASSLVFIPHSCSRLNFVRGAGGVHLMQPDLLELAQVRVSRRARERRTR